jgi:hypothetical protein
MKARLEAWQKNITSLVRRVRRSRLALRCGKEHRLRVRGAQCPGKFLDLHPGLIDELSRFACRLRLVQVNTDSLLPSGLEVVLLTTSGGGTNASISLTPVSRAIRKSEENLANERNVA